MLERDDYSTGAPKKLQKDTSSVILVPSTERTIGDSTSSRYQTADEGVETLKVKKRTQMVGLHLWEKGKYVTPLPQQRSHWRYAICRPTTWNTTKNVLTQRRHGKTGNGDRIPRQRTDSTWVRKILGFNPPVEPRKPTNQKIFTTSGQSPSLQKFSNSMLRMKKAFKDDLTELTEEEAVV